MLLNNSCTLGDLYDQGIELVEGLKLVVDDQGWRTNGIAEYSEKHDSFVAVIDWSKFVSPTEDVNIAKRWKYLSCRIEPVQIRRYFNDERSGFVK